MKHTITPTGYIGIDAATRVVAELTDDTEADQEWMDIGDRLNDAVALDRATRNIRQWLCDGTLTAYAANSEKKVTAVPAWFWVDDRACLDDYMPDELFGDFRFFHADGVRFDGIRTPVFLKVSEFSATLSGNTNPAQSKTKSRPGRPRGSGAIDDGQWLDEMQEQVLDGITPWIASIVVVAEHQVSIERKTNATDQSVAQRLYNKGADPDN